MSNPGGRYFVAGLRSDAVSNATGKAWREWFSLLDQAGADQLPETDITRYLSETQGLSSWWSRMVTLGYEQARGRRQQGWTGEAHRAVVRGSFRAPRARLFQAWAGEAARRQWLPGQPFLIRKAVPDESMRITWTDNISRVNVRFFIAGIADSRLELQHLRLASAEQAGALRAYWAAALERLDDYLVHA